MEIEANHHIANTLYPGTSLCGISGEFKLSAETRAALSAPRPGPFICSACQEALKIQREQRFAAALAALPPGEAAAVEILHEVLFWESQESRNTLAPRIAKILTAAGVLWED